MDIFTRLNEETSYSMLQLQAIIAAWVASGAFEGQNGKASSSDGHVDEADYTKQSVYSLLYSIYRSVGDVTNEHGGRPTSSRSTPGAMRGPRAGGRRRRGPRIRSASAATPTPGSFTSTRSRR
jgi:hypothetical protein